MPTPESFKINVSDELLRVTRIKLESARFPDELRDVGWQDGTPTSEIKPLRDFWLESYNWKAEEEKINEELPQFQMEVPVAGWDRIRLHFVHKRSTRPDAIPLIDIHTWM
jgi:Epoxide hydrolase N terminus